MCTLLHSMYIVYLFSGEQCDGRHSVGVLIAFCDGHLLEEIHLLLTGQEDDFGVAEHHNGVRQLIAKEPRLRKMGQKWVLQVDLTSTQQDKQDKLLHLSTTQDEESNAGAVLQTIDCHPCLEQMIEMCDKIKCLILSSACDLAPTKRSLTWMAVDLA